MKFLGTIICCVLILVTSFASLNPIIGEELIEDGRNQRINIYLKAAEFDPLFEKPDILNDLTYSRENHYFLVQCKGPIQSEWIEKLSNSGATFLGYIPDFTYLIHLESDHKNNIEMLPFIRWIGTYKPAYKFEQDLSLKQGNIQLNVQVFNDKDSSKNILIVKDDISALDGTIIGQESDANIIIIEIDASKITELAQIPQVEWIDQYSPPRALMDNIRVFTGASSPLHEHGFNGSGIVGEVKDSGIDENHLEFDTQLLATDGNVDEDTHGTSTFGIVFAKGANEKAKGMLPGAKGVFASWGVGRKQSIANLVNRWDGVFQSNSWSSGAADSSYASNSRQNDDAVFEYDVTMLYATGNGGSEGAISQEATAKNVIGVGAFSHYNNQDRTDDRHTGNQGNRGPTDDGRIKPDVVGPYDSIYTTTTNDRYTSGFGGTSGATPIAAGAVGLIYQMYRENHFDNNPTGALPHAATVKALLIANAYQYEFSKGNRMAQGWGLVDVGQVYDVGANHFIDDQNNVLQTGKTTSYEIKPTTSTPLKISLVWTDVPGTTSASRHLINNIDLKVTDPNNQVYYGNYGLNISKWSKSGGKTDNINNVENVFIEKPLPGTWTIEILGINIPMDGNRNTPEIDQSYALVVSGVAKYEHDLRLQTMDHPKVVGINEKVPIDATIMNIGTDNEADIKVNLLVDNNSVDYYLINKLGAGESIKTNFQWQPTETGNYYISVYIEPQDGEVSVWDNRKDDIITVNILDGKILVDDGHGTDQDYQIYYNYLETMTAEKYRVYHTSNQLTPNLLAGYDVLISAWPVQQYSSSEIGSIEEFVNNGGGLLVIGEYDPEIYSALTNFAGIDWGSPYRLPFSGETNNINTHEITENVNTLYFDSPRLPLIITPPAEEIVYTYGGIVYDRITVAAAEYGSGKIVAIADTECLNSQFIYRADNILFGENIIRWLNNERPISIISSPLNYTNYLATESIQFDGSSSYDPDSDSLSYLWSSSISGEIGDTRSFKTKLTPGVHIITLEVSDSSGKTGVSGITLRVLNPPMVSVESHTMNTFVSGIVNISGKAWDNDGSIVNVEVWLDGSTWLDVVDVSTIGQWSNWTVSWNSREVSDGNHRISVKSMDNDFLNSSILNLDLKVDNTLPSIVSGPEVSSITSTEATIEWRTNEPSSGFLEYGTDNTDNNDNSNNEYGDSAFNGSYLKQHKFVLTGLEANTIYYYKIQSQDQAGNTLVIFEDLVFETEPPPDFIPPVADITSPKDGDTLNGDVLLEVDVTDNYGLAKVEFYINDELMFTDDSPEYYWLWDSTLENFPDGQYTVKIVAFDLSGNEASDEITIIIDNVIIYPSIISTGVSPNSIMGGEIENVLFTIRISDPENRLERAAVDLTLIGGSSRQTLYDDGSHGDKYSGDNIYSFEATISDEISAGEKSIIITLYHSNDKTIETEVTLYVSSPVPEDEIELSFAGNEMLFLLSVVIIIALVATGVGALITVNKRKKMRSRIGSQAVPIEVLPLDELY
jgi:hypothetical protein